MDKPDDDDESGSGSAGVDNGEQGLGHINAGLGSFATIIISVLDSFPRRRDARLGVGAIGIVEENRFVGQHGATFRRHLGETAGDENPVRDSTVFISGNNASAHAGNHQCMAR